jgi:hypothetical protein
MPVRRRRAKRRVNDYPQAKAWRMVFGAGYDYLHELRPFGIDSDEQARVPAAAPRGRALARNSWGAGMRSRALPSIGHFKHLENLKCR